jgi:hypothetical protein
MPKAKPSNSATSGWSGTASIDEHARTELNLAKEEIVITNSM